MGPVETAIRKAVKKGDRLFTPSKPEPFWVGEISVERIVLELGTKRTKTPIEWGCIEGILPFIKKHGRIRINGSYRSQRIVEGTLDGYLKKYVNRVTAGWIAALLEKAGVVVIDRSRPAYVRANDAFILD